MQAGTGLTLSYTPFTLQNFTDSILLNVTNTAATGVVPQGALIVQRVRACREGQMRGFPAIGMSRLTHL